MAEINDLYKSVLMPLNKRLLGPLEKGSDDMIPMPMVFVLGNHSSGKSSWANYLAGQTIQATGVAPTDDSFTIIAPGNKKDDQDGHALVGDPAMGFRGLQQFGSSLVNHLVLKVRPDMHFSEFMLVDSPGMIDAPVTAGNESVAQRSRDRGYDFAAVVKWLADRADVILLFQDPQKPGTTGETLSIMTTALAGLDYKTYIILNKADQFGTVHDFARAYGTLCWNLSKVIQRKDMPRIYTMCTPVAHPDGSATSALKDAMPDLEATRNEIVAEVYRAPVRRADNLITRLHDNATLLRMHATVLSAVKKVYMSEAVKRYGLVGVGGASMLTLAGSLMSVGAFELGMPLAALTVMASAGAGWHTQRQMQRFASDLVEGPGLEEAFRRVYYLQLAEKNENVAQVWERVQPTLRNALKTLGIQGLGSVRRSDLQALDDILDTRVPRMRQRATKSTSLFDVAAAALGAVTGRSNSA